MGWARAGRLAPPPEPPSNNGRLSFSGEELPEGSADFIELAYRRGKLDSDDQGVLERLRHRFLRGMRETFVTQPLLKGADVVTTDGKSRTRVYAPAIDRLRTLHSGQRNARSEAQKIVGALFHTLTPEEYGLANRYLFAQDAWENLTRGVERRPGFTEESVSQKLVELQELVDANPDVKRVVESYQGLMQSVREVLTQEGFLSPRAENVRDWYYPHTVLDFTREIGGKFLGINVPKLSSSGIRWRDPKNTLQRKGSSRDISTHLANQMENYLTDVFTQIEKRRVLNEIGEHFDVRNNPTRIDAQGNPTEGASDVKQIPPGYKEWDANRGYARLRASSVYERLLGEMMDFGGLDELAKAHKVDPVEFRQALEHYGLDNPEALIEKLGASLLPPTGKTYVIPEELSVTLDHAIDTMNRAEMRGISEHLVRGFKTAVLNLAPLRYNYRNMVGDVQRMYTQFGNDAFDPELWKSVTTSVHNYYRHNVIDTTVQQMLDHGVSSSGRIQSEYNIATIDPHLKQLEYGIEPHNLKQTADALWRMLKVFPELSSMREDIVRGVVMQLNMRRVANGQMPLTGVADKELVQGLMDVGEIDRAVSYIARKSLLDYGDFTPRENKWRNGIFPFYSWAAGNFQFWSTLAREISKNGLRSGGGSMLARGSSGAMLKGTATMATVLATVRIWNSMLMGDEEERLPQSVQSKNHFILPDLAHWQDTGELRALKDDEGKTVVWSTADALDDFMTYLGLDTMVPEGMSVLRGTLSKEEYLERQKEHFGWGVAGPARTALTQLGPTAQAVAWVTGKRLFPDPFNPSDIPPEQRISSLRDLMGIAALPGIEGGLGAVTPGANIFQPTTKSYDIPGQLGLKSYREPNIMMEGGRLTMYEADLVKQMQQKLFELRDLQGRMVREKAMKSNRQLDADTRQENFDTRMVRIDALTQEIQRLSERYRTLRRSRRVQ